MYDIVTKERTEQILGDAIAAAMNEESTTPLLNINTKAHFLIYHWQVASSDFEAGLRITLEKKDHPPRTLCDINLCCSGMSRDMYRCILRRIALLPLSTEQVLFIALVMRHVEHELIQYYTNPVELAEA